MDGAHDLGSFTIELPSLFSLPELGSSGGLHREHRVQRVVQDHIASRAKLGDQRRVAVRREATFFVAGSLDVMKKVDIRLLELRASRPQAIGPLVLQDLDVERGLELEGSLQVLEERVLLAATLTVDVGEGDGGLERGTTRRFGANATCLSIDVDVLVRWMTTFRRREEVEHTILDALDMAIDSGDGAENAKTRVGFTGIHEAFWSKDRTSCVAARVLAFS